MEKVDRKTIEWIESILTNDEVSTDEELIEHFIKEGGLSPFQAKVYVSKRTYCLNRFFIEEME